MSRSAIVYFSGTHGSGKSTLLTKLIEYAPERFERFERLTIPRHDETLERSKIRLVRYYLHTFQEEAQAQQSGKAVLCDRSSLDNLAYMHGFKKLGWISSEQHTQYFQFFDYLFPPERRPQNVIFVNPPLDTIIKHLKKRWQTEPKKWREDNFEYLESVRQGFQELYANYPGNVLNLTTPDLDKRITQTLDWVKNQYKAQKLPVQEVTHA